MLTEVGPASPLEDRFSRKAILENSDQKLPKVSIEYKAPSNNSTELHTQFDAAKNLVIHTRETRSNLSGGQSNRLGNFDEEMDWITHNLMKTDFKI